MIIEWAILVLLGIFNENEESKIWIKDFKIKKVIKYNVRNI